MRHPLEDKFNASAGDILSAIEHGFRAQVDVKGKLAEYFLFKHLQGLLSERILESCVWQDKDGMPDFIVGYSGKVLRIECKNVRSNKAFSRQNAYRVEIQKTRNAIGGGPTRGYRVDEFDVLAACLFNQTHEWTYLYTSASALSRRPLEAEFLQIMHPVPMIATPPWHVSLIDAIREAAASTGTQTST